jgi:hypothetical protein
MCGLFQARSSNTSRFIVNLQISMQQIMGKVRQDMKGTVKGRNCGLQMGLRRGGERFPSHDICICILGVEGQDVYTVTMGREEGVSKMRDGGFHRFCTVFTMRSRF